MIYSTVIGGSTVTATAGGSTIIVNNVTGVWPVGITNDTDAFTSGGIVFSGSNLTFGTSVDGATQYIQATAGGAGIAIGDGASNVTDATVVFADSNGISFGINGSTITAEHNAFSTSSQLTATFAVRSHTHGNPTLALLNLSGDTASVSNGWTISLTGVAEGFSNTSQFSSAFITAESTHAFTQYAGILSTGVTGANATINSSEVLIDITGGVGGAALKGSGTYTQNSGTIQFANSNDITFGLTANQMTASFSQSTHAHDYLLTANSSLLQHTSATSVVTSAAFPSANTTQFAGIGESTGTISGTDLKMTVNTDGVSVEFPKWITTYAAGGGSVAFSAGASSDNLASLVFSNSNNVSFGLNGSTVTGSASFSQSVQAAVIALNGSSGSLSVNVGSSLSSSVDGSSITIGMLSDWSSIIQSAGNYITTAAQVSHSHGNPTLSLSNLSGATSSASNGLTISLTGHNAGYSNTTQFSSAFITAQSTEPRVISINGTSGSLTFNGGSFIGLSQDGVSFTWNVSDTSAITTAAFPSANTTKFAGQGTSSTTTSGVDLKFTQNSLGLSYAQPAYITTYAAQSAEPRVVSLNGSSGSMSLNVGSSLSASSDGSTIVFGLASNITTALQPAGAYLTGYTETQVFPNGIGNAQTVYTSGTIIINGQNNITVNSSVGTGASSQSQYIQISGPNAILEVQASNGTLFGGTAILSGYTNLTVSQSNNTFRFSIADAIPLSNSTAYATSVLSASFQQTGNYLTTAAQVGHTHGSISIASTGGTDLTYSSASNGLTLSVPNWITTYAAGGSIDWSVNTTAGTDVVISTGAATNTFYYPKAITGYTESTHDFTQYVGLTSTGITGGSATISSNQLLINIPSNAGSLGFNDSNGVTFGVASTTSNSSTVVTASIAAYGGTSLSTVSTTGSVLLGGIGTAGLSLSVPAWLTTAAAGGGGGVWSVATTAAGTDIIISTASDTNTLYHPAFITTYTPGGGGADWSISSITGTDILISTATNTITLYQPDYITGYTESTHAFTQYVGLTSTAITGGSATIASDQLLINIPSNAGNLVYSDGSGITFGVSTAGSTTTVTASVNAAGLSLSTVSTDGSVLLGGVGTAGISLSVPAWLTTAAGGGGVNIIASDTTYTSGSVSFRGTNITIGTSAGGQYVDLSVAAPATSSAYTYMQWHNFTGNSTHVAPGQNTIWYSPFELMSPVSASSLQIGMTFNGTSTSAATAQWGLTQDLMLMARHSTNSTRFDSIWSSQNVLTLWISGTSSGSLAFNAETSSSNGSRLVGSYFYGQRIISAAVGSELSKGFYMFAYRQSFSTAAYSALVRSYNPVFVGPLYQAKNFLGAQTNISIGHFLGGRYSVTSAGFPASIGVSELLKSNDINIFFIIGASS